MLPPADKLVAASEEISSLVDVALFSGRFRLAPLGRLRGRADSYWGLDTLTKFPVFARSINATPSLEGVCKRVAGNASLWKAHPHPNLVNILECGQEQQRLWIISELVGKFSLDSLIQGQALPVKFVLELAVHLLSSLKHLHRLGILHSSITPQHLLLDSDLEPSKCKLMFPVSSEGVDWQDVEARDMISSAVYAAPEQNGTIHNQSGHSSDLYAIGCVLYHCLSGYPPYSAGDLGELLLKQTTLPFPSIRECGIKAPRALDEILRRATHLDSASRYQTADGMLADVAALLHALDRGEVDPDIVVGSRDLRRTLARPAFVARGSELELLDKSIAEALEGRGGLLFIEAVSGCGKSRLMEEFTIRCRQAGIVVLSGKASRDTKDPYQVLEGIARDVLKQMQHDPTLAPRLNYQLGELGSDVSMALPCLKDTFKLVAVDRPETGPSAELRTIRALAEFLNALGTREAPVVVILDDCQWELPLLSQLLLRWQLLATEQENAGQESTGRFVQLVAAFRSDEVGKESGLRRLTPAHHVMVPPLPDSDVRRLLESMAGPLPGAVVELVCRLAEGSPFMASAILYGLVEQRVLEPATEGWRADVEALGAAQSSARAADFLTQRLNQLSSATQWFLSVGALLGAEFDFDAALRLSESTAESGLHAIEESRGRNLVWWQPATRRCSFVHDKIREAFQGRLTQQDRVRLHRLAADYLLAEQPDRVAELAFHFDAAGCPEQALPFALAAGNAARQRHALDSAEQNFRIALRSIQTLTGIPRAISFQVADGLGDVLMLRGKYVEAEEQLNAAAELAEGDEAAEVCYQRGELRKKRGDMEGSLEHFHQGLELLGPRIPRWVTTSWFSLAFQALMQVLHSLLPRMFVGRRRREPDARERQRLKLLSGYSHASWYCGNYARGIWAHVKGLNYGEQFLPSLELAQSYSDHSPAMVLVRCTGRAIRYVEKSMAIRRALGDLWGQGQALHFHGIALYAACRYEECIEKCRQSIRILERTGDYWQVHIARYQIASSYYRLGRLADCVDQCQRNYHSGIMLGDEQASGIILDVWSRATSGRLPEEIVERELKRERRDAQGRAQVLLASAVMELARDRPRDAIRILLRARNTIERAGVENPYTVPVYSWLATAYRTAAEQDRSLTRSARDSLVAEGISVAWTAWIKSLRFPVDLPRVLREYALLEFMRARVHRGSRLLNRSLKTARAHSAHYDFALSLLEKGRISAELDWPRAAESLEQARELLRSLESGRTTQISSEQSSKSNLSLVDRFDTLLKTGRRIISALTRERICKEAIDAARRLLRAEEADIIWILQDQPLKYVRSLDVMTPIVEPVLGEVIADKSIRTFSREDSSEYANYPSSGLYVPIQVRGQVVACLTAVHQQIRGHFGKNEERIAGFIATLTGAAFENAEGFSQLERLNATLEQRVADRTATLNERADQLAISNRELERTAQELISTQLQLEESVKIAKDANDAKSRFLAAMSHEIRTPLNGIIGMAELAMATDLTDRQRTYLSTVGSSGKALLAVLNDVLDFSRIEAGKLEIDAVVFDVHELVTDACRLLSVSSWKKGLEFHCLIEPDVPLQVKGDPNRLRQVLINLIGNAIKFTDRGEITITVSRTSETATARTLKFSVQDSGIGIPAERLDKIFNAFDQGEISVTRRYGGTGLGLAISSQLVQLMGGRIRVDSQVSQGTVFHVEIPFPRSSASAGSLSETMSFRLDQIRGRVLVVSSCAKSAKWYVKVVESFGMSASGACTIEEARRVVSETPVDIMLVDVSVGCDAEVELIYTLSVNGLIDDVPILALVPAGAEHAMEQLQHAGAAAVVVKPTTHADLQTRMQNLRGGTPPRATDSPQQNAVQPKRLRIMVVDDSDINLEVAEGLLQLLGYDAIPVGSGLAAIELLRQDTYDAIFMDLEMPDLDGLETTRAIREQEAGQGRRTPILAMSAHVLTDIQEQCRLAGMDGFVSKPIQPEEIRSVLDSLPTGVPNDSGYVIL